MAQASGFPSLVLGQSRSSGSTLPGRLVTLALIFALELAALSIRLDNASLIGLGGAASFAGAWGAWIVRGIVGFCGIFATFAWLRYRSSLNQLSASLEETPVSFRFLSAHFAVFGAFFALSVFVYGSPAAAASSALLFIWLFLGIAAILFASLGFLRPRHWKALIAACGPLWLYSLFAVIVALIVGDQARALWAPGAKLTFRIVDLMLRPFLPGLFADPSHMLIGTARFNVEIAPECSGFEGAGLILSFGVLWLLLFRSECRFPRALLLIPAAVVLLFLLNSVRIAALILIGNAGADQIAVGGFHSQAGWIAFNGIALGFCAVARRIPWFSVPAAAPVVRESASTNPVAPWVMPFVAILAAGMISRALTASFEWTYPLRFLAAAGTLWLFRQRYRTLDWGFGWPGIAAGIFVFAVWIGLDRVAGIATEPMPRALAAAPPLAFSAWIAVRALAATVTVPIAEEFAFRGFLLRRLVASDFESMSFTGVRFLGTPWFALALSSIIFGLLHGDRWIAGTIAGLAYGLALGRKGRIGDAIIAHGLTNALIAADVLWFGQWQLW